MWVLHILWVVNLQKILLQQCCRGLSNLDLQSAPESDHGPRFWRENKFEFSWFYLAVHTTSTSVISHEIQSEDKEEVTVIDQWWC